MTQDSWAIMFSGGVGAQYGLTGVSVTLIPTLIEKGSKGRDVTGVSLTGVAWDLGAWQVSG